MKSFTFIILFIFCVSVFLLSGCQHEGVSSSSIIDIVKLAIIQQDNVKDDNISIKKVTYNGHSHWSVTYQIKDKHGKWIVHGINVEKMENGELKAYFASKD